MNLFSIAVERTAMEKRSVPPEAGRKNSEPVLPIAQWHLGNLVLQRVFAERKKLNFCFPAMKKKSKLNDADYRENGVKGQGNKMLKDKSDPPLLPSYKPFSSLLSL